MLRVAITTLTVCLAFCSTGSADSLWNKALYKQNLFADRKAHQVGDILTIVVSENTQASESAQSGSKKEHKVNLGITSLFNAGQKLFGLDGAGAVQWPRGTMDGSSDFKGSGNLSRKSKLTAQISAVVKAVEPNGNLLVEGRRTIYLDKEKRNIIITGVVRPDDVSSRNTVESTAIADAEIVYEGFGSVTDSTKPGLLSKILRLIPIF